MNALRKLSSYYTNRIIKLFPSTNHTNSKIEDVEKLLIEFGGALMVEYDKKKREEQREAQAEV